jgi:hypothetical protein
VAAFAIVNAGAGLVLRPALPSVAEAARLGQSHCRAGRGGRENSEAVNSAEDHIAEVPIATLIFVEPDVYLPQPAPSETATG